MRKREDVHREFVSTEPVPGEQELLALESKRYKREKLTLEVMLDTRELLERLLLKQELQEKKALLLEGPGLSGMGEMD